MTGDTQPAAAGTTGGQVLRTLAVRITDDLRAQLDVLAQLTGRSTTEEIRLAIEHWIAKSKSDPNLLKKADTLVIGGGMVFTFLKAQGLEVGKSLLDESKLDVVREYMERAEKNGVELVLPVDTVIAPEFSAEAPATVVPSTEIPSDQEGMDIGPETAKLFGEKIADAATVFWNGPMGVFEFPAFAEGTRTVAQALTDVTREGGLSVVGGGDSAAAVRTLGFEDDAFGHISTGGGASLEYLEGKELPGVSALQGEARA